MELVASPRMIATDDLAYMAGVVDLLGLIRTRMAENTELPLVQMHGQHMPILQYFGERTGTKAIVTRRDYTRAGCAEHCQEKHQHIVSVSGRWSVTGAKATVLLWNLRPFLRVKADLADRALAVGLNTRFKQGTAEKMRRLGWEIPEFETGLRVVPTKDLETGQFRQAN